MQSPIAGVSRRQFLGRSAVNAAGLAAGLVGLGASAEMLSPADPVRVGVIGVRRQGRKLAKGFSSIPGGRVDSLCDVDESVLGRAGREMAEDGHSPRLDRDYRRLLDDPNLDVVVIATPDHSHAALTRLALEAGKDVYLETPVCHSIAEGQVLLAIAEKSDRVIQSGTFERSLPHVRSAMRYLHSGELGAVPLVKAWSVQRRPVDQFIASDAPSHVDYSAWLFPQSERPFEAARFHRGWANFWDYGSGDLGTWGVALLDLARWGIGLEQPERVSAVGHHVLSTEADAPDTLQVTYASPKATVVWEHRRWSNHAPEGRNAGVAFHGERGTLVLDRGGWKVYDGAEPAGENGSSDLVPHLEDFLRAVRSRGTVAASLRQGVASANFCHWGNLAYRLGRDLVLDRRGGGLGDDEVATRLDRPAYLTDSVARHA